MVVVGDVCGRGVIGRSSVGRIGCPFSRLDELCGCEEVGRATVEWPFIGGCSEYLMNNLSPWLRSLVSIDIQSRYPGLHTAVRLFVGSRHPKSPRVYLHHQRAYLRGQEIGSRYLWGGCLGSDSLSMVLDLLLGHANVTTLELNEAKVSAGSTDNLNCPFLLSNRRRMVLEGDIVGPVGGFYNLRSL